MEKQISKKQIITIAGKPGSGKSTSAKGIAKQLSFNHFSSGDLFRKIAKEHSMDVLQANLNAEKDGDGVSKIDYLVDEKLRELGASENKLVIDSRMAWHWMPYSFRVFLDLDLNVAAKRILSGLTPERMSDEEIPNDVKKYAQILEDRLESEARRYNKAYEVNPYDTANYDLVVDTNVNNISQVIKIIEEQYNAWCKKNNLET